MKKSFLIVCCSLLFAFGASAQLVNSLDESANNSQGQYQPMNLGYAGFNSIGMTQAAWLDPLQNLGEGQTKPAYSKYYWNADLVLPIRLREAMVTIVNFPEWEMIESIQFGDSNSFSGDIASPNSVLLWTKGNIGVDTNIIMFGRSGNKYVFYVKSESVDTERLTNAIVDIEIPEKDGGKSSGSASYGVVGGGFSSGSPAGQNTYTRRFQKQDWLNEIPFNPNELRFDMEVYVPNPEDVVIAPERVWRDDIFTYIDLGEKSLTMTQRPIVTQIVERTEVPVGFRTKGPNNRLIVVEGIGDFVLRNGKRIICLKLRRSDAAGIDGYTSFEDDPAFQQQWDVSPAYGPQSMASPAGSARVAGGLQYANVAETYLDYDKYLISQAEGVPYISGQQIMPQNVVVNQPMSVGSAGSVGFAEEFVEADAPESISIQLGTGDNVVKMEDLWSDLSAKYPTLLKPYTPFFSVDTPADGQGRELFHLRAGPVKDLREGDSVCSQLGRRGVFCSVIRTQ